MNHSWTWFAYTQWSSFLWCSHSKFLIHKSSAPAQQLVHRRGQEFDLLPELSPSNSKILNKLPWQTSAPALASRIPSSSPALLRTRGDPRPPGYSRPQAWRHFTTGFSYITLENFYFNSFDLSTSSFTYILSCFPQYEQEQWFHFIQIHSLN